MSLEFQEKFILAKPEERQKLIDNAFAPFSLDHHRYTIIHALNEIARTGNNDFKEVEERLGEFSKLNYAEAEKLRKRLGFMRFNNDKVDPKELEELVSPKPNFHHYQPSAKADKVEYSESSVLNPDNIPLDAWAEFAGFQKAEQYFSDHAMNEFYSRKVEPHAYDLVMEQMGTSHHSEPIRLIKDISSEVAFDILVAHLESMHRNKSNVGFRNSTYLVETLTLEQLETLRKKLPHLNQDTTFIDCYIEKLAPNTDEDMKQDEMVRKAYWQRMETFLDSLDKTIRKGYLAVVLFDQLQYYVKTKGTCDKDTLKRYLAIHSNSRRGITPSSVGSYDFIDLPGRVGLLESADYNSEMKVIKACLRVVFMEGATAKSFYKYFTKDFIGRLYLETKLVYIQKTDALYKEYVEAGGSDRILTESRIEFCEHNKRLFGPDDEVSLLVDIKNVPSVTVKVFEMNTYWYYKEKKKEITSSINLDGLVANYEETFTYENYDPIQCHREVFTFDDLKRRGVFVVDIIGNGMSSRAVIRKGQWTFVSRTSVAGHIVTVLDEEGNEVENATINTMGPEFKPTKDGSNDIVIPYTSKSSLSPILITADGFTTMAHFNFLNESYLLNAGIYVDRETLIRRNQAKFVVKPQLKLHGMPVTLQILEDVTFTITSTDMDGVESVKEFKNVKFEEGPDAEYLFEFQVSDNVSSLSYVLEAKVTLVSQHGRKETLSVDGSVDINAMDRTMDFQSVFLVPNSAGYDLAFLGKTGEPVAHELLIVELKHFAFTTPRTFHLRTDVSGRIHLGHLHEIDTIRCGDRTWKLHHHKHNYPRTIVAHVGETISVPFMNSETHGSLTRGRVNFRRFLDGNVVIEDVFSKLRLENNNLILENLDVGHYELRLKLENVMISISVVEGRSTDTHIFVKNRVLERTPTSSLNISKVDISDKKLTIHVGEHTEHTRVHVFVSHFFPSLDLWTAFERSVTPMRPKTTVLTPDVSNFVSGRDLGEEYRYILERKTLAPMSGNTLERPSLLINPWCVNDTTTRRKDAAVGNDFASRGGGGGVSGFSAPAPVSPPEVVKPSCARSMEFLGQPALVLNNLRPNEEGILEVDTSPLPHGGYVRILALDGPDIVHVDQYIDSDNRNYKDLRLNENTALDADKHYSERKSISSVYPASEFVIKDLATAKLEVVDVLSKVYSFFQSVSESPQHRKTLNEFAFLLQWPTMAPREKQRTYSKYACHELNFFLFKKDREFFNEVVAPFIAHKKEKTFLDRFLLGMPLDSYLTPFAFDQLNFFEKVLLGERDACISKELLETFDVSEFALHASENHPLSGNAFENLFKKGLKGSSMDTDDALGIEGYKRGLEPEEKELWPMVEEEEIMSDSEGEEDVPMHQMMPPPPPPPSVASSGPMLAMASMSVPPSSVLGMRGGERPPFMHAGRGPPPPRSRSKVMKKKKTSVRSHYHGDVPADLQRRKEVQAMFKPADKTKEYAEQHYWNTRNRLNSHANLVKPNAFWSDYANRDASKPFLSTNFIVATCTATEMLLVLAVLDLPWAISEPHNVIMENVTLRLNTKATGAIVFHQEIEEASESVGDILVSQNVFDPEDSHVEEKGVRREKYVTGEFLTNKVYGCRVIMTNASSTQHRVHMLLQIPVGALPVNEGFTTKSSFYSVDPYTTTMVEYFFYFPLKGTFEQFPVHIVRDEVVIAYTDKRTFNVVNELTVFDKTSWEYLSQRAHETELFEYLNKVNIQSLDLDKVLWRCRRSQEFWKKLVALLRSKLCFHSGVWSYGIHHGDRKTALEYISRYTDTVGRDMPYIACPGLISDPIERLNFEHLEYKPFVNARVHKLGSEFQILCDALEVQYKRLLGILVHKPELSYSEALAFTYYLLLYDRVEEALKVFALIDEEDFRKRADAEKLPLLQYDYMMCYLDFYNDNPVISEKIANKYKEYPVPKWRNLFLDVLSQLEEIRGVLPTDTPFKGDDDADDAFRQSKHNEERARKSPSLEFTVENNSIKIAHENVTGCTISYYEMDIELLFSTSPFITPAASGGKSDSDAFDRFAFVKPNLSKQVTFDEDKMETLVPIPKKLSNANVMIIISCEGGIVKSKAHFANQLRVTLAENYGQVRVRDDKTLKPLPRAYVKVYSKTKSNNVRFYKDMYTDIRGVADYVSLMTDELPNVQKFSILVSSETHGTVILEASPPKS